MFLSLDLSLILQMQNIYLLGEIKINEGYKFGSEPCCRDRSEPGLGFALKRRVGLISKQK
jgi:hypothetical protein